MKWTFNPFTGKLDAVGFYFKENGYTLELWFKGVMVTSYTIDAPAATPLTADDGATEITADDGTTPLTGD